MRLRSSLTDDQVAIWRRFGLLPDLEVKIPRVEERVQNPPHGWLTICETTLRSGFRFPPCKKVIEILKFCGVLISQFTPLGVVHLMGLVVFFREHGGKLSLDCFRGWCDIRSDGGERAEIHINKSWLDFETRTDLHHENTLFGYVKNSWGLPELWNTLPDCCRRQKGKEREFFPVLGFSEARELANQLFNISSFVEEKHLLWCGISSNSRRVSETSLDCVRKRKVVAAPRGGDSTVPCSVSQGKTIPSDGRGGLLPRYRCSDVLPPPPPPGSPCGVGCFEIVFFFKGHE
ncbi:hypothetical protein KSP40_PGU000759 [Platanthera guangdongensis]|uniref:Uncharacterized protein n=1 Tax=Platanthera guangdongensis TaxID=2320717 RepID=A0ABR2MTQ6_9ASPA